MTCIVAWKEKGDIYMGGDSAAVSDYDLRIRKDKKVFKKGPFLIGYTSSFRMGQLIRFHMEIPEHPKGLDDYEYMCTLFINSLRQCLKEGGYMTISNSVEFGGEFLVGYRGEIYHLQENFQIGVSQEKYNSVGCGAPYALGALATSGRSNQTGTEIVRQALAVAEKFSAGVRRPFIVLQTPVKRKEPKISENKRK